MGVARANKTLFIKQRTAQIRPEECEFATPGLDDRDKNFKVLVSKNLESHEGNISLYFIILTSMEF